MKKILIILFVLITFSCSNPFAPKLVEEEKIESVLADQSEVDGLFFNWSLAYNFQDTVIYTRLLSDNFTFSFRDFELGVDKSWGRQADMLTTNKLFQTAEFIELNWNEYIFSNGDSLNWDATRNFSLKITFSIDDIVNITGRARVKLIRPSSTEDWLIQTWIDESNF